MDDFRGSSSYLATGLLGRITGGFSGIFGAFLHGVASLLAARLVALPAPFR